MTNDNSKGSDWLGLASICVEDAIQGLDEMPTNVDLLPRDLREFADAIARRMLLRAGCPVVLINVGIAAARRMIDYTFPDKPPRRPEVDFG